MSRDERAIRIAAVRDFKRFRRIKATGHQIQVFIQRHRLTPGADWSDVPKESMAEYFATQELLSGTDARISEEVVKKLEEYFGVRDHD